MTDITAADLFCGAGETSTGLLQDAQDAGAAPPILATNKWASNAHLIRDCFRLGYLGDDGEVLDMTYGLGVFWKLRRPASLTGVDIDPSKAPDGVGRCFTNLPYSDGFFKYIVYDPPYKLNGAPTASVDSRYGVHTYTRWQERMELIIGGLAEAVRLLSRGGFLLVKCQDQVCSGKVVWQTLEVTNFCITNGLTLVDRMDMLSYRPQPPGRKQVHARRNTSTLLIFEKMRGIRNQIKKLEGILA